MPNLYQPQVRELSTIGRLFEDGAWMHPNVAANLVYKLTSELDMDTTGRAGY